MRKNVAALLALAVLSQACYHATIDTGRAPGPVVIDEPWAKSFVYGLVPPDPVSTMQKCPNGVAKVETEHSFLNALVGGLTWGIFTPMHITVTCAAPGGRAAASPLLEKKKGETDAQLLKRAAELSDERGESVTVKI